jgi:hypothetical protein
LKNLASLLDIRIKTKQEKLESMKTRKFMYPIHKKHTTIPDEINNQIITKKRNQTSTMQNVLFDKIKTIEEIPNTTNYAYDLTVKDTRIFCIKNGSILWDTFHTAGSQTKSNVTRGVPRMEEILSLSSEPKNPSMTIHLKEENETDRERAQSIMYTIEHTRLEEIVTSVEICFDPDDMNTLIDEDKETMAQFQAFESKRKRKRK